MTPRDTAPVQLRIRRLRGAEDLPLPAPATADSAGFDLRAHIDGSREIAPGERALIPTGIAIELPRGYEAQIRPRSGLAIKHGVTLLNSPGTIDADYRGEISVIVVNHGSESVCFRRADRIAQLVVHELPRIEISEVDELAQSTRGAGGFGHTGR